MSDQRWEFLGSELLRNYRVLRLREDRYRFLPRNAERKYAVCDSADWVLIIPITDDDQVVFVRQFRHGRGEQILEIPGGVMEPGEQPAETAGRELLEETGFVPRNISIAGPLLPNPALNTACCYVAIATGCVQKAEPRPDPFEDIELALKPLKSVSGMIADGELKHALCIAAFAVTGVHLA